MESIRSHRGFTLIELLVVLAIITIIMAVVFTSQSAFNKTLVLANTAYDVALTFRSAESYGLGSRASGMVMNTGYGLDFQSGTPGSYTLFADTYPSVDSLGPFCHPVPPGQDSAWPGAQPGNCVYDPTYEAGSKHLYTLNNGIIIKYFCAIYSGDNNSLCSSGSPGISSLDVVFSRPNPTPLFSVNNVYVSATTQVAACLALTSPQGGWKYVSIAASGEINANATSCP